MIYHHCRLVKVSVARCTDRSGERSDTAQLLALFPYLAALRFIRMGKVDKCYRTVPKVVAAYPNQVSTYRRVLKLQLNFKGVVHHL